MIFNLNGEFVAPDEARWGVTDGACLYGDTLFETLLARGRTILGIADHLDRLELSARLLAFPCDRGRLESALGGTAERLTAPVSRLRLTLSRGPFAGLALPPTERGHFAITAVPYAEPTEAERSAGAACLLPPNRRVNPLSHLPQMKRGNYADCLYAADFARTRGAREALFIADGRLLEGATSNLFLVFGGTLVTPPAGDLVLAGTMRRRVLLAAALLGIPAEEREVPLAEAWRADEAFLTSALIGLLPVAAIDGRPLRRGELWRRLHRKIEQDR